ncbi:Ubiquitin Carboxyl-Terminal Hydrolase 6 [Manis pentadactyla]|nr:Ubiquitin Carboxyl-Terminal Hydrolase 6 [Manis pentadactyla]
MVRCHLDRVLVVFLALMHAELSAQTHPRSCRHFAVRFGSSPSGLQVLPPMPPINPSDPPEASAGPGAFAAGITGTESPEGPELPHPGASKGVWHRRVPTGPMISPRLTDGDYGHVTSSSSKKEQRQGVSQDGNKSFHALPERHELS